MANTSIDDAQIIQFSENLHARAQQVTARTKPYAIIKPMTGDYMAYDGVGILQDEEIVGRNQPVSFADVEFWRRKVTRKRFAVTVALDDYDVRGMLTDPQSPLVAAAAAAMQRRWDRVFYNCLFADVLTGRDMGTTVTFANDGGLTVTATGGFTYAKLLNVMANYIDNDVMTDGTRKAAILIAGDEHTALMSETQLISGDYSRQYAVENGQMQMAAGFELIKFAANAVDPILTVSGGVRSCAAVVEGAVCMGISSDMKIKVEERNDLYETTQIKAIMTLGAVRTEGKLVQKITTTD